VKKAVVFWGSREIPNNHDPALFAELVPALRWAPGWWFWAPLGVVGLAFASRRPGVAVLAGIVGAVWLENVLFFGNGRFRVPAAPFLVVAGAGALTVIARGLRGERVRKATRWLAAACGLGLLMHANPYGIPREIWPMSYVLVAEAEHERGEPARALRWIERALAEEPSLYPARFAQVQLLRRTGRAAEALEVVERLLRTWPSDAQLRAEHGVLLDLAGRSDAALAEIDAALALDPTLDAARVHRAVVLGRLGRTDEARDALLALLLERPASPEAPRAREVLGGLER
jgi:tetratricopeptide (TPR) repeat protein